MFFRFSSLIEQIIQNYGTFLKSLVSIAEFSRIFQEKLIENIKTQNK